MDIRLILKSMYKKKSVKIFSIILVIIVIGIVYFNNDSYHQIKREIIKEIEAQITEMELHDINELSYYNSSYYVNSIMDKEFLLKIIKNIKPNRVRDLTLFTRPVTYIKIEIGDIIMGYDGSYWFAPYNNSFILGEEDKLELDNFLLELRQRNSVDKN